MSDSAIIIRDGKDSHRIQIAQRDWTLLSGPGFGEGLAFIRAFGIFENYTVASGIREGSLVKRSGATLYDAALALLAGVTRDLELLRYDYSYQVGDEPRRYGGGQSIRIDGRDGILSLQPKGYCSIQLIKETGQAKVIDLRGAKALATDSGRLKVYRRKANTRWPELLPTLLAFLEVRREWEVTLEHIDRVG
jgi:hypothetical protein